MEWHNILDPDSPELDRLAERYHLHPLHIEDCRHRDQNAKIEEADGYIFTVMKGLRCDGSGVLEAADFDIFLGADFVITVVETDWPEFCSLAGEVKKSKGSNLRADQIYYQLVDHVVDSYLPILDRYDDLIDGLEDKALGKASPETLSEIFTAKRNLILLRRVLINTRDVAGHLQRTEASLIQRDMWPFLRDVYDHVTRNLDTVEMQRDLLTGALDVYLSSVANRTNQVMKILTVLGTIFLPAVVVTGFYGMNVQGLPGASSAHGMAIAVGVIVGSTALLLVMLKHFDWL